MKFRTAHGKEGTWGMRLYHFSILMLCIMIGACDSKVASVPGLNYDPTVYKDLNELHRVQRLQEKYACFVYGNIMSENATQRPFYADYERRATDVYNRLVGVALYHVCSELPEANKFAVLRYCVSSREVADSLGIKGKKSETDKKVQRDYCIEEIFGLDLDEFVRKGHPDTYSECNNKAVWYMRNAVEVSANEHLRFAEMQIDTYDGDRIEALKYLYSRYCPML